MKKKALILLLIIILFSLTGTGYAEYKLSNLTISSGSALELTSNNYKLADIKGQPVIGESVILDLANPPQMKYTVQLGGVYDIWQDYIASKLAINVTLFLEGFYDPVQKIQVETKVAIEAREGAFPQTATSIIDSTTVDLKADGTGTGEFEKLKSGGYYLVALHQLPDNLAGPNHLPIITANKYSLTSGATPNINFSTKDNPIAYTPANKADAMPVLGDVRVMRGANPAGENKDGKINQISPSDFVIIQNNWLKTAPEADIRADLNGDGKVSPKDFVLLQNEWLKSSYVPIGN